MPCDISGSSRAGRGNCACLMRKEWGEGTRTPRLRVPTRSPSRISRASSLWPTSSKASVESWPPTSRRTSSPPGCSSTKPGERKSGQLNRFAEIDWGLRRIAGESVGGSRRHTGAVVDLVVDDHVQVFLQRESVLCFHVYLSACELSHGILTLEVCSDTSLKVNSLDILAERYWPFMGVR